VRFQETTYRPLFGRILSVAIAVLGAGAVASSVVAGDPLFALRSVAPIGLIVTLVFAAFWFPSVSVRADEIEVRNVFSTHHVPWAAIRRIDTKWALALETDRGTVSAWASPAPGRYSIIGTTRGDVTGTASSARAAGSSVRPGDALSTPSGAIAHVIRTHWEELRDDDLLDAPGTGTGSGRVPHTTLIVTCVVLAVATAVSILL
jgi:hypothetical protein